MGKSKRKKIRAATQVSPNELASQLNTKALLDNKDRTPADYKKVSLLSFMQNLNKLSALYRPGIKRTEFIKLVHEQYKSIPFYDEATFQFVVDLILNHRKTVINWLTDSTQFFLGVQNAG